MNRLKSRKSPWLTTENLINTQFCSSKVSSEEWAKVNVTNKEPVIRAGWSIKGACNYQESRGQQLIVTGQDKEYVDHIQMTL